MTQTAAKTAPRTARTAADAAMDVFSMNMPSMEIPPIVRDVAERTVSQAKDAYERSKAVAEEATDFMENAYETARQNARTLSLKAIESAQSQADASFALFKDLMGAKTFADAIELQSAFARKQFDAAAGQMKEWQDAAQKAWTDAAKPTTEAMEKVFASATKSA